MKKLSFASDYMEGAHEAILSRLREINYEKMQGYGTDALSEQARDKIRRACGCPDADVFFLVGGTQPTLRLSVRCCGPMKGLWRQ